MSITLVIVIITVIVSMKAFSDPELLSKFLFKPTRVFHHKEYLRLFTSGLIHADYMHLGINMYVLFSFGSVVEGAFKQVIPGGLLTYLLFYVSALGVSSLVDLQKHKNNPYYSALGASGATSAVLFAYILFFPEAELYFFGIIPIRGWLLGILYLFYSSHMSKKQNDNIGHMAHLTGAIYGIAFVVMFEPRVVNKLIDTLLP